MAQRITPSHSTDTGLTQARVVGLNLVEPCQAFGQVLLGHCPSCVHYDLTWDLCQKLQPRSLALDWRHRWDPPST